MLGCGGTIARKRRLGCGCRRGGAHRRGIRQSVTDRPRRVDRHPGTGGDRLARRAWGSVPTAFGFSGSAMAPCDTRKRRPPANWCPILEEVRPAEVFVTAADDGHPDHEAAYRIVRQALASTGSEAVVVEYPVWWWQHWPWGPLPVRGRGGVRKLARRMKIALTAASTGESHLGLHLGGPGGRGTRAEASGDRRPRLAGDPLSRRPPLGEPARRGRRRVPRAVRLVVRVVPEGRRKTEDGRRQTADGGRRTAARFPTSPGNG